VRAPLTQPPLQREQRNWPVLPKIPALQFIEKRHGAQMRAGAQQR
jgi:hypothetical protein